MKTFPLSINNRTAIMRIRAHKQVNPNCDGIHCVAADSPVRLYPLGGGGNLILCFHCVAHENAYRRQRGRETGAPENWPEIAWDRCKPYPDEG